MAVADVRKLGAQGNFGTGAQLGLHMHSADTTIGLMSVRVAPVTS